MRITLLSARICRANERQEGDDIHMNEQVKKWRYGIPRTLH